MTSASAPEGRPRTLEGSSVLLALTVRLPHLEGWDEATRLRTILVTNPAREGSLSNNFGIGPAMIHSSGGQGFPTVASIRVRENPAAAEEAIAGGAGFDPREADSRATLRSFRWTHRGGRFLFLQQAGGTVVLLQGYVPRGRLPRDPTITLRVGGVQSSQVLTNEDRVGRVLHGRRSGDRILRREI